MAAGKHNFLCEQGATFNPIVTWKDESETLVDLTGYTARMHVRPTIASAIITIQLTTENSRITLGGAAGTIELLITDEDTELLAPGTYKYDLEMVSSIDTVIRLLKGNFKVDPEVTREVP